MPIISSQNPRLDEAHDLLKSDPEKSLDLCNQFLATEPDHPIALQTKLSAYKRLKEWDKGLEVAKEMVRVNPKDCQAYDNASAFHYRLGNYQQAIAYAHQALSVDEDKWLGTIPYRLLAVSHAQLGELDQAMSYADKAHEIDPSPFIPYGPLPYGTLERFKQHLMQLASKV